MMKKLCLLLAGILLLIGAIPAMGEDGFLYQESFEEPVEVWTDGWINAEIGSRNRLSQIGDGFEGKGVRVSIPIGSHFGSSLEKPLDRLTGAWASYYLRIPFELEPGSKGKLPGFAGEHFSYCGQGGTSTSDDCWTGRMVYSCRSDCSRVSYGFYTYLPGQETDFSFEPLAMRLDYGRWYCVTTYVEMNTPGQSDGVLAAFVDGEWVYHRAVQYRRNAEVEPIRGLWWDVYAGGKETAKSNMAFDFDELVISSQPILREGCLESVPSALEPKTKAPKASPTTTSTTTSTTTTTQPPAPSTTLQPTTTTSGDQFETNLSDWPTTSWWWRILLWVMHWRTARAL